MSQGFQGTITLTMSPTCMKTQSFLFPTKTFWEKRAWARPDGHKDSDQNTENKARSSNFRRAENSL